MGSLQMWIIWYAVGSVLCLGFGSIGLQDHTDAAPAVDAYPQWPVEAYHPDMFCLCLSGMPVEIVHVEDTVVGERIDGEISYAE